MSLLTIVQQAFSEVGFGSPTQVVGNADLTVQQAQGLVNRAGLELRDADDASDYWLSLRKQFLFNLLGIGPFTGTMTPGSNVITGVVFTGTGTGLSGVLPNWQASSKYLLNDTAVVSVNVGGGTVTLNQNANLTTTQGAQTDTTLAFGQEAYAIPSDLNYFIPQTGWDRNFRWQLLGPVDAQEWQVLKSGISPVGPRLRYRLMANQIYVNPSPYVPTGQSSPISDLLVLEYASLFWASPAGSVNLPATGGSQPTQASMQLDTDICLAFPEDLITKSLKWRILKAKGMSYAEEFSEYEDSLNRTTGRFTMPRNLPLNARASGIRLLNSQNVPDTGFGS
jgi:hypothetical protein